MEFLINCKSKHSCEFLKDMVEIERLVKESEGELLLYAYAPKAIDKTHKESKCACYCQIESKKSKCLELSRKIMRYYQITIRNNIFIDKR